MNGNGGRIAVLLVALLALGILVLPSTVSLFAGQHNWYSVDSTDDELPCEKCHQDIFDEFQNTGEHDTLVAGGNLASASTADIRQACYACHRAGYNTDNSTNMTYANATAHSGGEEAHAATTIACMACHQGSDDSTYPAAPYAGGFVAPPSSDYGYTTTNSPGGHSAHQAFVNYSVTDRKEMTDANEACIACHTHVPVDINWTHKVGISFNVTPPTISGDWDTSHFDIKQDSWGYAGGNATARVWGNTTGNGSVSDTQPADWPGANPGNYNDGYS